MEAGAGAAVAGRLLLRPRLGHRPPARHLSRLTAGGLVTIVRQGRHRYFRIATLEVAAAIEGLMNIAPRAGRAVRPGPRDEGLLERLRRERIIQGNDEEMVLGPAGERWCDTFGIDLAALRSTRRQLCRSCLDWTERRTHLAGGLGAAILERMLTLRYARR